MKYFKLTLSLIVGGLLTFLTIELDNTKKELASIEGKLVRHEIFELHMDLNSLAQQVTENYYWGRSNRARILNMKDPKADWDENPPKKYLWSSQRLRGFNLVD